MPQFNPGQLMTATLMNSLVQIVDEQQLDSNTATVTFNNIDQSFKTLLLLFSGGTVGSDNDLGLQFNGDTGSNYVWFKTSRRADSTWDEVFGTAASSLHVGRWGTTLINTCSIWIAGYSRTDREKPVHSDHGKFTSITAADVERGQSVGHWNNTSAITSITVMAPGESYRSGSIFSLYGLGNV